MKRITDVFAVSMIAALAVGTARADVAAVTYVDTMLAAKANAADVYTKTEVDTKLDGKQAAGDYATTIALNAVKATADAAKATADTAVQPDELATVATSGSYNDLTNKPTIPAAQVQSDWNATSGVAAIANKPTLATVATSGSYNDLANKPTIPAAQVQTDWNATSGVAAIANKPTLATVATSGSYNDLANKPTIPSGALASKSTISNADVAANAAIAPTKIAIEKSSTYEIIPAAEKDQRIPSVSVAEDIAIATADAAVAAAVANVGQTYQVKSTAAYQMGGANGAWTTMTTAQQNALNSGVTTDVVAKANSALQSHQDISGKQDKTTAVTHTANTAAGDSTHPVYVASNGVATKIDKVAAASTADSATTATTATNAKKICNGSACASYVDIWVE